MKSYRAELHVHTVLSPCADVEMIPPLILQTAQDHQIHLLAITDHNASANVEVVISAARGTGIHIIPGMELQTREEVHLLCLFDTLEQITAWQLIVDQALPSIDNDIEHFGEQFVVDASGDFVRREPRLLLNSTHISLDDAVDQVHKIGGLAIPAHINRKAFGLIQMLGFVPPEIPFDALEISRHITPEEFLASQRIKTSLPLIQSGDVHRLDEFIGRMEFEVCEPSICEIRKAFSKIEARNYNFRFSN